MYISYFLGLKAALVILWKISLPSEIYLVVTSFSSLQFKLFVIKMCVWVCCSASPHKDSDAEMTIKTKLKTKALLHDFHLNVTCSQVVSTLAECQVHNQVWGACWPSYEQQAMGMTCSVLCRCSREVIRRKSSLHDSFTAVNEHSTSGVNGPYPSLYSLLQGNLIRQGDQSW